MYKKTFISFSRINFLNQCLECASFCQFCITSLKEQTNSVFLVCNQRINVFQETQKSIKDAIEVIYFADRYCFENSCDR